MHYLTIIYKKAIKCIFSNECSFTIFGVSNHLISLISFGTRTGMCDIHREYNALTMFYSSISFTIAPQEASLCNVSTCT